VPPVYKEDMLYQVETIDKFNKKNILKTKKEWKMQYKHIEIKTGRIYSIIEVGEEETYDIQNFQNDCYLNEPNFFADGFLVHNSGKHAGGIAILDSPVCERLPVERVRGELVTAFPESSQEQVLDELGIVKFDVLAISIFDVIRDAINLIDEKLFLIEEDGTRKVVGESYLNRQIT
jgi:DNA polymerase III alpha subunit